MSKQTINMALHDPAAWPGSREHLDDVIALRAELHDAKARAVMLAEDLSATEQERAYLAAENAAQAVIIGKLNHTNDELRYQMRLWAGAGGKGLLTLTDRGDGADGYGVME